MRQEISKADIQQYTKDLRHFEDENPNLQTKVLEYEAYNKVLLEKVKEFNEEKQCIINQESEKSNTIKSKCEEFKTECASKFQVDEIEDIKKENESLRTKLEEYKNQAKSIEDGIKEQMTLKDQQTALIEGGLENQINPTFTEFEAQIENYAKENKQLREEMEELKNLGNEISLSLGKCNFDFESLKKEFEKKTTEVLSIMKLNKEYKSLDASNIQKDNESLKSQLDIIVAENKSLADKIAKLKEKIK